MLYGCFLQRHLWQGCGVGSLLSWYVFVAKEQLRLYCFFPHFFSSSYVFMCSWKSPVIKKRVTVPRYSTKYSLFAELKSEEVGANVATERFTHLQKGQKTHNEKNEKNEKKHSTGIVQDILSPDRSSFDFHVRRVEYSKWENQGKQHFRDIQSGISRLNQDFRNIQSGETRLNHIIRIPGLFQEIYIRRGAVAEGWAQSVLSSPGKITGILEPAPRSYYWI